MQSSANITQCLDRWSFCYVKKPVLLVSHACNASLSASLFLPYKKCMQNKAVAW